MFHCTRYGNGTNGNSFSLTDITTVAEFNWCVDRVSSTGANSLELVQFSRFPEPEQDLWFAEPVSFTIDGFWVCHLNDHARLLQAPPPTDHHYHMRTSRGTPTLSCYRTGSTWLGQLQFVYLNNRSLRSACFFLGTWIQLLFCLHCPMQLECSHTRQRIHRDDSGGTSADTNSSTILGC